MWEDDTANAPELTNAGIIASNLMGTPASGTGNFVVHQREVTFVSFETSNAEPEESPAERAERDRIVYESLLRSEGEATPVADDDMGVGDFGGTQVRPTTIVTPIVQTTQLPPGADLPRDPDDVAWVGGIGR